MKTIIAPVLTSLSICAYVPSNPTGRKIGSHPNILPSVPGEKAAGTMWPSVLPTKVYERRWKYIHQQKFWFEFSCVLFLHLLKFAFTNWIAWYWKQTECSRENCHVTIFRLPKGNDATLPNLALITNWHFSTVTGLVLTSFLLPTQLFYLFASNAHCISLSPSQYFFLPFLSLFSLLPLSRDLVPRSTRQCIVHTHFYPDMPSASCSIPRVRASQETTSKRNG